MQQKFLEKDNVQIYYEILQGEPMLIFLHGATVNHTVFNKQIEHFKDKCGILAIDLRGDGKSSPKLAKEESYSLENNTQDLEDIIKKEQIENPIIIGHSNGGMIGINYASRNDNISSLVLIETSYDFKKTLTKKGKLLYKFRPIFRKYLDNINKKALKEKGMDDYIDFSMLDKVSDLDFAKITYEKVDRDHAQTMHVLSEAVLKWNVEEQLTKIDCPTLIINAEKSQFIKPETAYELQKRIVTKEKIMKYVNALIIPNAKHQLIFQNADIVNFYIKKTINFK